MSVAITVRQVPETVRDELAARAAHDGRSLQEFLLRHLVAWASRPTVESVIDRARSRARATGIELTAEEIVADRNAERR